MGILLLFLEIMENYPGYRITIEVIFYNISFKLIQLHYANLCYLLMSESLLSNFKLELGITRNTLAINY